VDLGEGSARGTQNVAKVGGEEVLRSLADSQVTLTGKIELYKGKLEIVISSPAQIVRE
jgi:hypothetical protein